jgi:type I restriction enzyme S subunit
MGTDTWVNCKLAEACSSIDYGYTASAKEAPIGPRFLRITDIVGGHIDWTHVPHVEADTEVLNKYRLSNRDIVLARTGASTGSSMYIQNPPDAIFASYLVRLKINNAFDPRFISYYLKTDDFWSYIHGVLGDKSAQPNASASTMTQAPLRAPKEKNVQAAIAHILGTLDDKIELNRKMNQTLEAMARAIFKSWFVDFDPVRAKAEGRDQGLPTDLVALFSDSFDDSELGEIPKVWRVGSIDDLVNLSRDSVNPLDFPAEQFYHFSIPAFDDGRVPKTELGAEIKSNKFIVTPDSVLLSKLNPRIPRIWLPNTDGQIRSVCSTEFLVASPKTGISREYLFSLFTSQTFDSTFATLVTGTSGSHQRVKTEGLLGMQVIVPSENLIAAYTKIVKPLFDQANKNIYQSRTIAALRDALLPKLLAGELRVDPELT